MAIDAYTSQSHYIDHLAPIWLALPRTLQGTFRVGPKKGLAEHAARWGILTHRSSPKTPATLVASYADERACKGQVALLEHGAGQTYGPNNPDALPTRLNVTLYLAPNKRVADRMAVVLPAARRVVVGSPRLEHLASQPRDPQLVVLAWHWSQWTTAEARTAWGHYKDHLRDWRAAIPNLVGHGHPRILRSIAQEYVRAGIPIVDWANDALRNARVVVADNTSLIWEACALDVPVVLLDAPWYRRDVEHGLRFWEWAHVGPRIIDPAALPRAIKGSVDPFWGQWRRQAGEAVYGPLEGSIDRAVAAVVAWAK